MSTAVIMKCNISYPKKGKQGELDFDILIYTEYDVVPSNWAHLCYLVYKQTYFVAGSRRAPHLISKRGWTGPKTRFNSSSIQVLIKIRYIEVKIIWTTPTWLVEATLLYTFFYLVCIALKY